FLTNVGQVEKHKQKADSIIHRIRVEYFKLNHLKNINYDNFCLMTNIKTDFYIKESAKNGLYDSANHIKNNEEDLVNRFVKKNIYNLLFDIEASNGKIPINISSIVRDKQQILIEKNITLNDGLAGIGLAMLHHVDAK
ncbi:MAG TPA: hypothetical protein VFQ86_09310, partial [Arachidicoccus soli]|nr:hypothetical protein [Arachidicoccus soli]